MAVKTMTSSVAADVHAVDQAGECDSIGRMDGVGSPRKRARVKVGGVYVTGDKATPAQLKHSVAASTEMLERLGHAITRPGVQLQAARNIPLFSADPQRPGRFLRKLNGKIEPGVLEDGAFKVVD